MSRPSLLTPEGQRRLLAELDSEGDLTEHEAELYAGPPPTAEELPELAALAAELAGRTT